jgi:resolvase-like protein
MLPNMVGAVIYVRVSTKEQTENLSLPTQLKACEEYCERQGFKVLALSARKARARKPPTAPSSRSCCSSAARTRAPSSSWSSST